MGEPPKPSLSPAQKEGTSTPAPTGATRKSAKSKKDPVTQVEMDKVEPAVASPRPKSKTPSQTPVDDDDDLPPLPAETPEDDYEFVRVESEDEEEEEQVVEPPQIVEEPPKSQQSKHTDDDENLSKSQ